MFEPRKIIDLSRLLILLPERWEDYSTHDKHCLRPAVWIVRALRLSEKRCSRLGQFLSISSPGMKTSEQWRRPVMLRKEERHSADGPENIKTLMATNSIRSVISSTQHLNIGSDLVGKCFHDISRRARGGGPHRRPPASGRIVGAAGLPHRRAPLLWPHRQAPAAGRIVGRHWRAASAAPGQQTRSAGPGGKGQQEEQLTTLLRCEHVERRRVGERRLLQGLAHSMRPSAVSVSIRDRRSTPLVSRRSNPWASSRSRTVEVFDTSAPSRAARSLSVMGWPRWRRAFGLGRGHPDLGGDACEMGTYTADGELEHVNELRVGRVGRVVIGAGGAIGLGRGACWATAEPYLLGQVIGG